MIRVAIVEDEPTVIEGLTTIIDWGRLDMQVCGTALDGVSGVELVQREHPDVIVTDIRMAGMDGLSLIARCKEIDPAIVSVIFTGYNEFRYAQTAVSLGVIEYVEKPVSVDRLEAALRKAGIAARERQRAGSREAGLQTGEKHALRNALATFVRDGTKLATTSVDRATLDELTDAMRTGSEARARRATEAVVERFLQSSRDPDAAVRDCLKIVFHVLDVAENAGFSYGRERISRMQAESTTGNDSLPAAAVEARANARQLAGWLKTAVEEVLAWYFAMRESRNSHSIGRIIALLEKRVSEEVSLDEIARVAGLTPSYTSTVFKRHTGMTLTRYLVSLRIGRAKLMLRRGSSLDACAHAVGYRDPRYFSRIFRREVGMTPEAYRSGEKLE